MNLNEFYDKVSRLADTAGIKLNRAECGRVLALAFKELAKLPTAEALALLAKGTGKACANK